MEVCALLVKMTRTMLGLVAVAGWALAAGGTAHGGGGPENVLVVANPRSPTSLAIANAYVHLRKIPPGNVVYLPFDPDKQIIQVDVFRDEILKPILEAINERRLAGQIDCIAYSSDYPWGIEVKPDVDRYLAALPEGKKHEWPKILTMRGSLTSLTYLWQAVMARSVEYMSLESNRYAMHGVDDARAEATRSFHGRLQFDAEGREVDAEGRSYLLSVQLGATPGKDRRGNTPTEVFSCLVRSAGADGTRPRGTIYYADNGDVRSKARSPLFPLAAGQLEALGVAAVIVKQNAPTGRSDVQGVTTGMSNFDWAKQYHSRILPGAICDNLTSAGGVMASNGYQTPLTEFIRYGAAGASGTVIEPYALPPKFPSPMIHVHYARGCSLAEAYYQSVLGPYQLLIVGDPLCQPWARFPKVSVSGAQPGAKIKGALRIKPSATLPEEGKLERFELFVDGLLVAKAEPEGTLELDTAALPDGHHELRVVAVGPGPIHTRGRAIVPIECVNHGRAIEASCSPTSVPSTGRITLDAKCPGAARIEVFQNRQSLGRIDGPSGRLEIKAQDLGAGPVQLQAVGVFAGSGPKDRVFSKPIDVTVQWPGQ